MRYHDLADFRTWGFDHNGWRDSTRYRYSRHVVRADLWLKAHRNVPAPRASTDSLAAWLSSMPPTPTTRNGARNAMVAYYTYLQSRRRRRDNPALALPRLREPRRAVRAMAPDDAVRLLKAADLRGPKWFCAVLLLLDCGLRAFELRHLEWAEAQEGWLIVADGKGGHQRTVPLHPVTGRALADWRPLCPSPRWVLPGRWPDQPISYQAVYRQVRTIAEDAGLDGVHPHLCRSTYATSLLDEGADVRTVQHLLGHATLATTSRYLAARDPKAQAAVDTLPWHR